MDEIENYYDDQGNFVVDEYLKYLHENSRVLSDEAELVLSARGGDKLARKKLVASYLFITAELALRLAPPAMEPLRAIQEANLVLMRIAIAGIAKPASALGPAIEEHFAGLQ
ncbi:MAG: hypothetical protein ABR507_01385 [Actinomycetota bacterium]|nr:hypothetical protein [Actinomycetota bacterium]